MVIYKITNTITPFISFVCNGKTELYKQHKFEFLNLESDK